MYKRLIILSIIIAAALCGLSWLGYRAIEVWTDGIEGARIGEFAEVAGQITADVQSKLDEFMVQENKRPYTDYQYYYVPDAPAVARQQVAVAQSPLAERPEVGLGYNNFQINPDNSITTPIVDLDNPDEYRQRNNDLYEMAVSNTSNLKTNLLPILDNSDLISDRSNSQNLSEGVSSVSQQQEATLGKGLANANNRAQSYNIESFRNQGQQVQIQRFSGQNTSSNEIILNTKLNYQEVNSPGNSIEEQINELLEKQQSIPQAAQESIVDVIIEPFEPIVLNANGSDNSIFSGQVFMLRRVLIEGRQYYQGFQLNEQKLLEEVKKSTQSFLREGMGFELGRIQSENSAFLAVLDFDFGHLLLNLIETNPAFMDSQISHLRVWYFSILGVVFLVVTSAMGSLWMAAIAQMRLARKKDDFVSAVSHELRTPLTSIRMHAEMLEKNWVKSQDKLSEYYSSMRTESERLSRLIENVLDFSRIQRGRKKYSFKLGDINKCVADVVEMMKPYAAQKGFVIETQFADFGQISFDSDAVTQIVVNLLDNAVKYSVNAEDKTIIVRTKNDRDFTLIEVEDHGPGVPHRQRRKIFEQFYRIGAEATRETPGSGLGLALVKRFAQAHNGFVEILNAKPTGAIFRVALGTE